MARLAFILIAFVALIIALGANAPQPQSAAVHWTPAPWSPVWEPDRRATQEMIGAGQNETTIAVNPLNRDNAIAVAKDFRNPPNQRNYLYTTTDGGATWLEQLFPRPNPDLPQDLDPAVFFRNDGRAYLLWTSFSDFQHGGLFTAWSDDMGLTWGPPAIISPPKGHFEDKAWLAFDQTGGPYNGTM